MTHAKAKKAGSSKLRAKFESLRREIKADMKKQHDLYVNNLVVLNANYLKILFVQILWHTWMNINSCQIDNMHSGKSIAVKIS